MSRRKLAVIIAGCTVGIIVMIGLVASIAPQEPGTGPGSTGQTGSETWVEDVTNIFVVAHSHDWDADAEDDGMRVWINLLDKNESIVMYTTAEIPVTIDIYSTESSSYPWEPERLIYSGTAVMRNWHSDAFVTGAIGVKDIAWDEISQPLASERQEYGLMYATVTLPNGRDYSGRYYPCRIR